MLTELQSNLQQRYSKRDYSGATTSSHVGHSAQIPSVPSSFSYSTSSHTVVIRSLQFGQRPRLRVSSGMERGWKERVTVFLPRKNCLSSEISVSQSLDLPTQRWGTGSPYCPGCEQRWRCIGDWFEATEDGELPEPTTCPECGSVDVDLGAIIASTCNDCSHEFDTTELSA